MEHCEERVKEARVGDQQFLLDVPSADIPRDIAFIESALLLIRGYRLIEQHDTAGAGGIWRRAIALEQRSETTFVVTALYDLSRQLEWQGRRRAAVALCQTVLAQCADEDGRPLPSAAQFFIRLGDLAYIANHLSEARRYVDAGIEVGQNCHVATSVIAGKRTLARILCASGEVKAACSTLLEAQQLAVQASAPQLFAECASAAIDLKLKQGELASAELWAPVTEGQQTKPLLPHKPDALTLARIRILQGRVDEALAVLKKIERAALERAQHGRLISIYVLHALAQRAAANEAAARTYLATAARLAATEDYDRYFLDEGHAVATLLPMVRNSAPMFVDRLMEEFELENYWTFSHTNVMATPHSAQVVTVVSKQTEVFSEREIEVLRLMAEGLSYREIGARLMISLNTVRFHVKSLYGKLNVHHRMQAIQRGRDLYLLVR
jgi:LuxR family maltose regulon positive regulatory protein